MLNQMLEHIQLALIALVLVGSFATIVYKFLQALGLGHYYYELLVERESHY